MTMKATSPFLLAALISLVACGSDDFAPRADEEIIATSGPRASWRLSDGSEYPSGKVLSRADLVISVSPSWTKKFHDLGAKKTFCLPNGFDSEDYKIFTKH